MYYIGIDLAWSDNHLSGVAIIRDDEVVFCDIIDTLDDISELIQKYTNVQIGVDAPLYIPNKTAFL